LDRMQGSTNPSVRVRAAIFTAIARRSTFRAAAAPANSAAHRRR
jgi:hypothetical protein